MMKIICLPLNQGCETQTTTTTIKNLLMKRKVRDGGALEKLHLYCVEVWKQVMLEAWVVGSTY